MQSITIGIEVIIEPATLSIDPDIDVDFDFDGRLHSLNPDYFYVTTQVQIFNLAKSIVIKLSKFPRGKQSSANTT